MFSGFLSYTRLLGQFRQRRQFRQLLLNVAVDKGFSSGGSAVGFAPGGFDGSDNSTAPDSSAPCPGVPRRASAASLPRPSDPHPCDASPDLAAGAVDDPRATAARPHPYRSPVWLHRPALTLWQRLAVRLLSQESLARRQWYRRHVGGRWADLGWAWARFDRCPDRAAWHAAVVSRLGTGCLHCTLAAARDHEAVCTCEVWP